MANPTLDFLGFMKVAERVASQRDEDGLPKCECRYTRGQVRRVCVWCEARDALGFTPKKEIVLRHFPLTGRVTRG
jgi:hypothetical protein